MQYQKQQGAPPYIHSWHLLIIKSPETVWNQYIKGTQSDTPSSQTGSLLLSLYLPQAALQSVQSILRSAIRIIKNK